MSGPPLARTLVRFLPGRVGERVRLCGWAHGPSEADPSSAVALEFRDHTGLVRLVAAGDGPVAPTVATVTRESAIEATGTVVAAGSGQTPAVEVVLDGLRILGPAVDPPPIDDAATLQARLDWRHLDLRRPKSRLVFEIQATTERAMRAWWAEHDYLELHSPKLRATPNRSGRELFSLQYFDRPAYLAQSPQFYKQMAMCAGLERVFEIGPVFRANPLLTSRHDTEFTSVDVEMSWIESHHDLMAVEEGWLQSVVAAVAAAHGADVARLFGRPVRVPETPFPRVTLAEAGDILAARGHALPSTGDIDATGERLLAEHMAAETGHELAFVTDYPAGVRPFYHMRLHDGSALTRSFDLLWNGLEVTTGAQREHRHERLTEQAGADPARGEVVGAYLDFFRHGCPPHGGFGLGLTRLLMAMLGVADVREVTFLPRDRNRLTP